MTLYAAGDRVFHPFFGAGTIVSVEPKSIGGKRRRYYVVDMVMDEMQIMVPIERAGTIGLRMVGNGEQLERMLSVFDNLSKADKLKGTARRARQVEMRELLKSGSFAHIRDTVRELYLMHNARPLGMMDRQLFERGKRLLAGEIALALGLNKAEALKKVERSLPTMIKKQKQQHVEG